MLPQPWIVLVEIINFLILVVLLQHFLYQPIMKTMAQREYSIAERLQSAERREQTAQAMTQKYQQLQQDWTEQRKARQHQLHQQLEIERATRLEDIRAELESQRTQWNESLRQEQKAVLVSLRDRVRSQLIQSLRAALRTLADITLEQQMVETFLHQLPTLSAADRSSLQAAIAQQAQQAQQQAAQWTIRTTFPLTHDLQSRLVAGIQKQMPVAIPFENITFETYEDYPCGIELRTKGYKLAWHLEHYLDSLESQLSFALDQVPVL